MEVDQKLLRKLDQKSLCGHAIGWSVPRPLPICWMDERSSRHVAHGLDIDSLFGNGNGGNQFSSTGAGSGAALVLKSCINVSARNIRGTEWSTLISLVNAGNGLPDNQGVSFNLVRGVTCGTTLDVRRNENTISEWGMRVHT